MYYSDYDPNALDLLAKKLADGSPERWTIFDNTALGHATHDALALVQRLGD
jgi:uncharacterized protein YecE (DUF72 family)